MIPGARGRRVFFSFHYQRDIWKANQVRNSRIVRSSVLTTGRFIDASLWEKVKRTGDLAVKRLINSGLQNTSVTAVLIGSQTASRRWVRYEIQRSRLRGNALLGIFIHNLRKPGQLIADPKGHDPFLALGIRGVRTYDWATDNGYKNFPLWIETAIRERARQR